MIQAILLILKHLKKDIAATHQSLAERDFTSGELSSSMKTTGQVWLSSPSNTTISFSHIALLKYICETMIGIPSITFINKKPRVKVRSFCQKLYI